MDHPLRTARARFGLTQAQAAARLRDAGLTTTQATLSKYESGEITPSPDVAAKIAAVLGISELELIYPERFGFVRHGEAA